MAGLGVGVGPEYGSEIVDDMVPVSTGEELVADASELVGLEDSRNFSDNWSSFSGDWSKRGSVVGVAASPLQAAHKPAVVTAIAIAAQVLIRRTPLSSLGKASPRVCRKLVTPLIISAHGDFGGKSSVGASAS